MCIRLGRATSGMWCVIPATVIVLVRMTSVVWLGTTLCSCMTMEVGEADHDIEVQCCIDLQHRAKNGHPARICSHQ
jgi:hypothetical protein